MKNFFDFTGKTVLITGASSGIGRATAELFGRQGASVAITYHNNSAGADAAVAAISEASGKAIAIKADVREKAEIDATVRHVESEFGGVDILVNNAGSLVERLRTMEMTEERWNEVMYLNATSAFFAVQAVVPKMLEKGSGVIVNVTSIAGRNGGALGSIHYSSAKAAMLTMTKGLAKEFASQGIRVNAVSPGVIDTPYHETFTTAEIMENLRKAIPMGREGRPDEVAGVIAFLASDAASYLCGETIEINGGLLMD
ncbi:MAG TPA: 3-oxoacyl-ACP reductase family protein [Pyrinomonadaceae bacterium]|nr:3-oxoacyl-ACP reductase family protein [Pyrinomonadaceae bacterium]